MFHLSTGLLQEYGIWQLMTAFGFFFAGLVFEAKLKAKPHVARSCAALGVVLCVDELCMLHECLDAKGPLHLYLGLEFLGALAIGIAVLKMRIFNRTMIGLTVLAGVLAFVAYALEFIGVDQTYVRLEEGFEVACALLALILAVRAPGKLKARLLAVRAIFWATLGAAAIVLILLMRPYVCPTVDHWSKKYFHEQIW